MDATDQIAPLDRAVACFDSLADFARALGVSRQVVNNWRTRGIPADMVGRVSAATGGAVTYHELRPDLFPAPSKESAA